MLTKLKIGIRNKLLDKKLGAKIYLVDKPTTELISKVVDDLLTKYNFCKFAWSIQLIIELFAKKRLSKKYIIYKYNLSYSSLDIFLENATKNNLITIENDGHDKRNKIIVLVE